MVNSRRSQQSPQGTGRGRGRGQLQPQSGRDPMISGTHRRVGGPEAADALRSPVNPLSLPMEPPARVAVASEVIAGAEQAALSPFVQPFVPPGSNSAPPAVPPIADGQISDSPAIPVDVPGAEEAKEGQQQQQQPQFQSLSPESLASIAEMVSGAVKTATESLAAKVLELEDHRRVAEASLASSADEIARLKLDLAAADGRVAAALHNAEVAARAAPW